ncbi:hypothetical protein B4U84_25970 [Westiellopsis prolifica IICB1]|nr:hypothetical protein B4U84_25970 [Westiellopsis prolifica IICB1]
MEELPFEVQQRLEVIQQLMRYRGSDRYGIVQQQAAQQLGISVRSLQRLVRSWQSQGIAGLYRQKRSDNGTVKISRFWQDFILKTYHEGNRGGRQMTRAQVFVRVKVLAQELGRDDYPGRTTVYRVLQPLIDKYAQKQRVRSLGWKGSSLIVKTREGLEIAVEWSNQVWQCDHTKVDVLVVDQTGEILGRPWLTTVIDTYSRCYVESTS